MKVDEPADALAGGKAPVLCNAVRCIKVQLDARKGESKLAAVIEWALDEEHAEGEVFLEPGHLGES